MTPGALAALPPDLCPAVAAALGLPFTDDPIELFVAARRARVDGPTVLRACRTHRAGRAVIGLLAAHVSPAPADPDLSPWALARRRADGVLVCPPGAYALRAGTDEPKPLSVDDGAAPPLRRRAKKKRSRTARVDRRVVLQVAPNPKKPGTGSHLRYAHWRVGETVEAAVARGMTRADVRYDVARGYVVVGPPVR